MRKSSPGRRVSRAVLSALVAIDLREDAEHAGIVLDPTRPESDPLTEEQWLVYVRWLDNPRSVARTTS